MEREQAIKFMYDLLRLMVTRKASDLFVTVGFPPAIKIDGKMTPVSNQPLTPAHTVDLARSIMNDRQAAEFEANKECNFAINPAGIGRFLVNAFVQQANVGIVLRVITTTIPKIEDLGLPNVLKDVIMSKRGLAIMVGATGCGKSTTLAAMVGYRNENSQGHIITIEDPVEFTHPHKGCLITQREVGVDTLSWASALKNTLRQAPDRIINFFPEERRQQLLMDLSLNLRGMISQRLIPLKEGKGRCAAVEIMLNSPLISDLIFKGEVHEIKEVMKKSRELGMQTFDQALFDLFEAGKISYEDALRNADSVNDLRLNIKLHSKEAKNRDISQGLEHLNIV